MSCGPQKDHFLKRGYKNMVSYFNGYYHANLNYERALKDIEENREIPTQGFLPLLNVKPGEGATSSSSRLDTAISKCEVILFKHPEGGWADDCRFLMARCYFYKGNYSKARQNLTYITLKYPDSDLLPRVRLWLAKVHYITGSEIRARETLNQLPPDLKVQKTTQAELAEMKATLLIQQEEYNKAISVLDDNLENTTGRKQKAYWNYLLGQLYEKMEYREKAADHYQETADMNISNELNFRAKLQLASLYGKGTSPTQAQIKKVKKNLDQLLEDDKYNEYEDQIYYQYALLENNQGNTDQALNYLKKSLANSKDNKRQKTLSYFKAGQLYFYDKQQFTKAEAYYDSAAQSVAPEMEAFDKIQTMSKTLERYVRYKEMLHKKDSLLQLSALSKEALKQRAKQVVEREIARAKRRERQRQRQMQQMQMQQARNRQQNNPFGQQRQGNKFYFESRMQVSRGKSQFQQTWGDRDNEDHWRRSVKRTMARSKEQGPGQGKDTAQTKEERIQAYVDNVPQSKEAISQAKDSIKKAYFQLGQMYAQEFQLPDSALSYYQKLVNKYETSEYHAKAYYAIYTILSEQGASKAAKIKQQLLEQYPNTVYAKMVKTGAQPSSKRKDFDKAYETLINLYEKGDYETAVNFSEYVTNKYVGHPDMPVIHYIRGSSFGYLEKTDSLKKVYQYLVKNFPNTEQAQLARQTLNYLNGDTTALASAEGGQQGPVSESTGTASEPESDSDEGNDVDPADYLPEGIKMDNKRFKGYELKQRAAEPVYVMMLVPRDRIKQNKLREAIADFNNRNFPNEKLRSSVFSYQSDSMKVHLAYISSFGDYPSAQSYLNQARSYGKFKTIVRNEKQDIMPVTPGNFRMAFSKKRMSDYQFFYKHFNEYLRKHGSANQ